MNAEKRKIHNIPPFFDENSEILILGSFPSVKSREEGFFYGHLQNRFWKVLATVFNGEVPKTISEKKAFLLKNKVALWDVLQSCEINGSSDSSIKTPVPNDINVILDKCNIKRIFVNGKTAERFYNAFVKDEVGRQAFLLPSTSPANASWHLDELAAAWREIKK